MLFFVRNFMKKVYAILLMCVFGIAGFAAGAVWGRGLMMKVGLEQVLMNNGAYGGGRGMMTGNFPGGGAGGNNSGSKSAGNNPVVNNKPVAGEVVEVKDGEITLKKDDGGSLLVMMSDSTVVSLSESATASDLQTGDQITVIGKTKTDGTLAADTVMIDSSK